MGKSLILRRASVLLCSVLALFLTAGCGKTGLSGTSSEEQVHLAVATVLDPLKDPEAGDLTSFVADTSNEDLETLRVEYGIDPTSILQHLLRGFTYSIRSVEVEGEKATAQVSITMIDTSAAMDSARDLAQKAENAQHISDLCASDDANAKTDLVNYVMNLIFEGLDATTDLTSRDVDITLSRKDNVWSVDPNGMDDLLNTLLSGLDLRSGV